MDEQRDITSLSEMVPAKKLKIFLVEEDAGKHEPLYLTILHLLHDAGIADATVFRGTEGFGRRRVIHTTKIEVLSYSLPVTIEATDTPEKIDAVVSRVAELLSSGLIEVSRTTILRAPSGQPANIPSSGGEAC